MKQNIHPELHFPFVEEMRQFSVPFFPDRKEHGNCVKWCLQADFPDEKKVLDTAYGYCRRCIKAGGYTEEKNNGYCLKTVQKNTGTFEEYTLSFSANSSYVRPVSSGCALIY